MNPTPFMVLHTLLVVPVGLALLLVPAAALGLVGVLTFGTAGIELARALGAALLVFGLLTLAARDPGRERVAWTVVVMTALLHVLLLVLAVVALVAGAWNPLGWLLALVHLLFAAALGVPALNYLRE